MTIKDLAALAGVSHQAVYKRLKSNGIDLAALKDPETGHFTEDGEKRIRALFAIKADAEAESPVEVPAPGRGADDACKELRNQVETLQKEVARLSTEVEIIRASEAALRDERDFLRVALENSQKLQALTASKIPNPPPALPVPENTAPVEANHEASAPRDAEPEAAQPEKGKGSRLYEWWRRVRGNDGR